MSATCATHPEVPAAGACTRCGRFYCRADQVELDGKLFCAECGARPDVDWLGRLYRPYEGRRSSLAWGLGGLGLLFLAVGLDAAFNAVKEGFQREGLLLGLGLLCLAAATTVHFFAPRPWARFAPLMATPPASACFALASNNPVLVGASSVVLLALFSAAAITDLRTKLFYRVPVPRKDLHKHFKRYGNNPLAIASSRVALVSLFVPGLGVVAIMMAALALARVNRHAHPPVTNASTAVGAILFSLFTSLMWLANFFPLLGHRH